MAAVNYTALKQVTGRQALNVTITPTSDVALTMLEEVAIMNGVKPEKKEALINRLIEEYANEAIAKMDVMDIVRYTQLAKKPDATAKELAEKVIPVKLMNPLPTKKERVNESEQRAGEVNE